MGLHIETAHRALPASISRARIAAKKRLDSLPRQAQLGCPVSLLLSEFEELVRLYRQEDNMWPSDGRKRNEALLKKISNRLENIREEVSCLSPGSHDGAVFQILLAASEPEGCLGWSDEDEARFSRLVYRAMDRLGDGLDAFPLTRDYLLPIRLDPKKKEAR